MANPVTLCGTVYLTPSGNAQCNLYAGHAGAHDCNAAHTSVRHPAYYGSDTAYEVFKVVDAWGVDYYIGNVLKYVCRAGKKPGADELEDLEKAREYLDHRISLVRARR